MDSKSLTVSVIINTDGRAASLRVCLESLRYIRYPSFEVVVVAGPTNDGTWDLCQSLGSSIVYGRCPVRNLSKSRNISIGLASGDILAFLDDDSIPEPEWLDDVMPAFDDPEVAVAGGFLHDHTGKGYQWTFGTSDRFGSVNTQWSRPTPELNFPKSVNFPFVMANSLFRHSTVADLGGFDEEFEYFLDENDMIARIVDNGWKIAQLENAFIHHKFLPSSIRDSTRVLTSWYSIIKNKIYFSIIHGEKFYSLEEIMCEINRFVQQWRNNVHESVKYGLLMPGDIARFEREVDCALRHGLERGTSGHRRLGDIRLLRGRNEFTPFPKFRYPNGQPCCVLLSPKWLPGPLDDAAQEVLDIARQLAALGVQVHVLTTGESHDRIDFENDVWVHRIIVRHSEKPASVAIEDSTWDFSRTMFDETREIASRRKVDIVYAPKRISNFAAAFDNSKFAVTHDTKFSRALPATVLPVVMETSQAKAETDA